MPLTRMSLSAGTICGSRAATAGIWIPAPAERMAIATKISQRSVAPAAMNIARARVTTAMVASAPMISFLRSSRSAQTPPKIEMTACGRNPNTAYRAMTPPDLVSRVRCHITAYCTSIEPNSETVCPVRKIVTSPTPARSLRRRAAPWAVPGRSGWDRSCPPSCQSPPTSSTGDSATAADRAISRFRSRCVGARAAARSSSSAASSVTPEPGQHVRPHRAEQVVAGEPRVVADRVERHERGLRPVGVQDGDRAVELDHRRRGQLRERVVEGRRSPPSRCPRTSGHGCGTPRSPPARCTDRAACPASSRGPAPRARARSGCGPRTDGPGPGSSTPSPRASNRDACSSISATSPCTSGSRGRSAGEHPAQPHRLVGKVPTDPRRHRDVAACPSVKIT